MRVLRPYQQQLSDNVIKAITEGYKDILVVASTGAGKTITFIDICERLIDYYGTGSGLILSHLSLLTTQTKKKFERFSKIPVGILQAKLQPLPTDRIIISTMQSSRMFDKLWEYDQVTKNKFRFIIVDESHRSFSKSYNEIFECFPDVQIISFTATPFRCRKLATGSYDKIAFQISLQELIDQKYLVPPKLVQIAFDEEETVKRCAVILRLYQERELGKKAIVFMKTKDECSLLSEAFINAGIKSAVVCDDVTGKKRDDIFEGYDGLEYDVLISVDVLTAGFDSLLCEVVMMFGTESITAYLQRTGRALRPEDGLSVKPHHKKQDARIYVLGTTPTIQAGTIEAVHNATFKPKKREECKTLDELVDYLEVNELTDTPEFKNLAHAVKINKAAKKLNMNLLSALIENRTFPEQFLNNLVSRLDGYKPIASKTAPPTKKQIETLSKLNVSDKVLSQINLNEAHVLLQTITGTTIEPYCDVGDRFIVKEGLYSGKHVKDVPWAYKSIVLKKEPNGNIAKVIRAFHPKSSPPKSKTTTSGGKNVKRSK